MRSFKATLGIVSFSRATGKVVLTRAGEINLNVINWITFNNNAFISNSLIYYNTKRYSVFLAILLGV